MSSQKRTVHFLLMRRKFDEPLGTMLTGHCSTISRPLGRFPQKRVTISHIDFSCYCSKKWKKLLTFPHVSECIDLSTTLKSDSYDYIVDQQPIGQVLFRQFCESSK